jgi:N-acetylmuramoyl-L-alanine amidase
VTTQSTIVTTMSDSRMQPLRVGDRGPAVADVQISLRILGLLADDRSGHPDGDGLDTAVFDDATERAVRHFQQVRGLSVDGRVGAETYRALSEARWSLGDRVLRYDPDRPMRGDDVTGLQERLLELGYDAGRADGILGPETEVGLRAFQRDYGLTADGTCGPATLRALRQLGRKVTGGRPQLLR